MRGRAREEIGVEAQDDKLEMVGSFDQSVDRFWSKIQADYGFTLKKDARFLNWRYCDRRGGDYKVKAARVDDDLLGFIVTRIVRSGDYDEGYIMDLMALPSRHDVADALMAEACKLFDSEKVNAIHYLTVKGNRYHRTSLKCGFVESPLSKINLFNDFTDDNKRLALEKASPERVQFSYGDYL